MSDFVEQCRREWKRLGVPDAVAEEMAADLASDVRDAEADGVSTEEFLGSSLGDPASFAASWATERGIIPIHLDRGNARRRPRTLVAFTALAAITVIVSALLLATGEPKVSLIKSRRGLHLPAAGVVVPPSVHQQLLQTSAAAPVEWILLLVALVALAFAAWLWSNWGRSRMPTVAA